MKVRPRIAGILLPGALHDQVPRDFFLIIVYERVVSALKPETNVKAGGDL
jgi:hypothetical protein